MKEGSLAVAADDKSLDLTVRYDPGDENLRSESSLLSNNSYGPRLLLSDRSASTAVADVIRGLLRHPVDRLILRWNWKSAILSSSIRALIFFAANLAGGLNAAFSAMAIEFGFRAITAGFYAAMTQSLRRAEPAWAASLAAMLLVPAVTHSMEFTVHWLGGTERLAASMFSSVCFSMLSTLFNLFAMRRGVLIVGDDAQPLAEDLKRVPAIVLEFVLVVPRTMRRVLRLLSPMTASRSLPRDSINIREEGFGD